MQRGIAEDPAASRSHEERPGAGHRASLANLMVKGRAEPGILLIVHSRRQTFNSKAS